MAKKIGIAVLVLVVAGVALIASRPDTFRVERSAVVAAPADVVFAQLEDFRKWSEWSPYEKMEPNLKKTYEGPAAGPGAVYGWVGTKIGEGRMTIVDTKPNELVSIKLEFVKPFASTNQAKFTLVPSEAGTKVTWSMEGESSFMHKAFSLVMDMDKLIGKDFESGLADLNKVAQAEAAKRKQTALVEGAPESAAPRPAAN